VVIGVTVQAYLTNTAVYLNAVGTLDAVAEVGEQLAWLGAAVRSSPDDWGLACCSPFIRDIGVRMCANGQTVTTCSIGFTMEKHQKEEIGTSNGCCWHALFRNPVIVNGFPIQARLEMGTGIEIPLNIMAGLVGARRIQNFGGNVLMKSFSIILLLTKREVDFAVWHLLYNDTGEHISYTDPRVWATATPWSQNLEVHSLQSVRHVVGWCSKVSSHAGKNLVALESDY
jgi:hypothetical protein